MSGFFFGVLLIMVMFLSPSLSKTDFIFSFMTSMHHDLYLDGQSPAAKEERDIEGVL